MIATWRKSITKASGGTSWRDYKIKVGLIHSYYHIIQCQKIWCISKHCFYTFLVSTQLGLLFKHFLPCLDCKLTYCGEFCLREVLAIIGSGEGDLRETKILDLFKKVYVSNYDMIFMSCRFNTLCLQLMSMHNVFNSVKGGKQTIMGMWIFNRPNHTWFTSRGYRSMLW